MVQRETRRALRAEEGLGVLMLDLDLFKKFNDSYGHEAGDPVLRVTALLPKSFRAEAMVCRFGGEEFLVIILPQANLKLSQGRAERIRSNLRELTVLHQGQPLGMVTESVGVAEFPQHGTSPRASIDAADAASTAPGKTAGTGSAALSSHAWDATKMGSSATQSLFRVRNHGLRSGCLEGVATKNARRLGRA